MLSLEAKDILAAVHTVPPYNRIPALLFGALAAAEGQQCSVQCGATAFVYKPSDLEAFVTAVSTLVRHWNEVGDGQDSVTKESRQ
jgi:response regulator RpfG family c-di-GMP phosphodiesterase